MNLEMWTRPSVLISVQQSLTRHAVVGRAPREYRGRRTTAAIAASVFGNVLKISEDGLISFLQKGKCVREI